MKHNFDYEEEENHDYWMSYSDLMAVLILMLVLFLSISAFNFNESTKKLNENAEALAKAEEKINLQQDKLNEVIGVRTKIIEMLMIQFKENIELVKIDQKTGDITLESGVFFDVDQYVLKNEGKEFLESFIPLYVGVLLDKEYSHYVAEIIIEGHTDTQGTFDYNLDLSQKRALEVAKYILNSDKIELSVETRDVLRPLLAANGKSFSNPILTPSGDIDLAASRRVEFKFRLRDIEMIEEMNKIIGD